MMKMKPLPKALLIAAILGVIGYGATFVLPKQAPKTEKPAEVVQTPAQVAPVTTPSTVVIPAAPEAPKSKVVIPEVEQARNAGLDKLLNSGNK